MSTRYWVYDPNEKKAIGPFSLSNIKRIKGFSLESLVAPDGAQDAGAWKPANTFEDLRKLYPVPPPLPGTQPPRPPAPSPAAERAPIPAIVKVIALVAALATAAIIARSLMPARQAVAPAPAADNAP